MGSLVGLDSNIFIYTLEGNASFGQIASQLLNAVAQGEVTATASDLVYLEVLASKNFSNESEVARTSTFLSGLGIAYRGINRQVLLAAAKLRREYSMKTPDAIHIASAVEAGATHFVSNDRQLLGQKIPGIELVGLNNIKEAILFPRDINRLAP